MAIYIRHNTAIKGVQFQNTEIKLSQFADDATYFLRHIKSLDVLLEFLGTFAEWSGLKINRSKSSILPVADPGDLGGNFWDIPVVSKANILGLWFLREDSIQNRYQFNFKPKLQKIKAVCDSWSLRNISIKGKVTVVNSLLISLLQYPSASTFTPPQVFAEYKRLVTDFIWSGKKPKAAYNTLILPVGQGGLGLMDLQIRVKVSSLQWIRRLLLHPASNVSVSLAALVGTKDLNSCFAAKPKEPPTGISHEPFYLNLFKLWDLLSRRSHRTGGYD